MASPPDYRAIAAQKAQQYGVPVDVFLRQIAQESGFNPSARSGAGAQGIAQFMPATAREYGVNTADPVSSLDGAARMDAGLIKKYGIAGALSAYNSGNPNAYKDPNFAHGQTYNYVRSILGGQQGSGGAGVASSPVPPAAAGQPDRSALMKALLGASSSGDYSGFFNAVAKSRQAPTPSVSPVAAAMAPQSGGKAGGFLAATAAYTPGRLDAGHDFQTNPGGAIVAPGAGTVVKVLSDPNGFGPGYPVVHFTSGRYAGQTIYIGHTLAALRPGQSFQAGQTLSRTGTTPVGNASVPGWAEIGFAPGGTPGHTGQNAPF